MKSTFVFWLAFTLSVILGALIWLCSQQFTGKSEPWDGSGYYWHIGLVAAGFIPALVSPRRFWLWPLGVLLGEGIILAGKVVFGPPSAFWLVGAFFLLLYSLFSFVGAFAGWAARKLSARATDSRQPPPDA